MSAAPTSSTTRPDAQAQPGRGEDRYAALARNALAGIAPSEAECLWILEGEDVELLPLLQAAYEPRRRAFGRKVMVHVLNNVQNGLCPEDCGYCSQNKDSEAAIRKYAMKSDEAILAEAEAAAKAGASRYCMVLSGRGPTVGRTQRIAGLIREIKSRWPIEVCLSAGLMGDEHAAILKEAGLDRMNHNLNTSESRYDAITSTHTWADRVATLEAAKRAGIESCSGMIVGMGEGSRDILEVAFKLRELEVPSIPVNFLIPIAGNRVQEDGSLTPERCLRVLCLMRFVNPTAELRVAGGREGHLRSMQPFALYPANSLFVEGYLTTKGDPVEDTYAMIRDAGFEIEGNDCWLPGAEREGDAAGAGRSQFRIPDGSDQLLKPEIARA
ncbi:MAG: biotin synthase BioB [Myxococcales bacterium]|nr:biotin synthase BioB [Myxococcales bacterium]